MNNSNDKQPIRLLEPADDEFRPIERRKRRRKESRPKWRKQLRKWVKVRIKWVNILIVIIAVLAVGTVGAIALYVDANNRVNGAATSLLRVAESLGEKPGTELTLTDFNRLQAGVDELAATLISAENQLGYLGFFRRFSPDLDLSTVEVGVAQQIAIGARELMSGLEPAVTYIVAGDDDESVVAAISSGERVVEQLRIGRSQFINAANALDAAERRMSEVDLANHSPDVILNFEQLRQYNHQLRQMNNVLIDGADLLATVMGLSNERHYLIVAQDSNRLRPTGGYPDVVGWMVARNGRIDEYEFMPVSDTFPVGSTETMPAWWNDALPHVPNGWTDAWQGDFAAAADDMLAYYNSGENPRAPVDGVIAIDINVFESLLGVIGETAVPGYGTAITAEDFRQITFGVNRFGGNPTFKAAVIQQIFTEWQTASADPNLNNQVLGVLMDAVREKRILMRFDDEAINNAVNLLGWGGTIPETGQHDFLYAVDANLDNSSNRSIARQINYQATVQADRTVVGEVALAYDYPARLARENPAVDEAVYGLLDYHNLLRVIVPAGSELTGADNLESDPITIEADGYTGFAAEVTTPFDSLERYTFRYQTGEVVEDLGSFRRYRLLLQKQPGAGANIVDVQLTLPEGATALTYTPQPVAVYDLEQQVMEFRLTLATDQWIEVVFQ